jgi:hypothetical protein
VLFAYPEPADKQNWFHSCLGAILQEVHNLVRDGMPLPAWPAIVPARHQPYLRRKSSLQNSIAVYDRALRRLSQANRDWVYKAFQDQNEIASLLANKSTCDLLSALPVPIRNPVRNLFEASFRLLTTLNIRQDHYAYICSGIPAHVCPFCGFEPLDGPGGPSEPMDHYLAISIYPFAGVNLKNLPFMGTKCNSQYKHDVDIIQITGTRRTAFYPYKAPSLKLDLSKSVPFGGAEGIKPKWVVEFTPHSPEVDTWLEVFHIQERYIRDVLDLSYIQWIRQFQALCKRKKADLSNRAVLLSFLDDHVQDHEIGGFEDRAFIRAAMFRMLHAHCAGGNTDLIRFLQNLVP